VGRAGHPLGLAAAGAFEVPFPSPQGGGTTLECRIGASSTNFAGVAAGVGYDATPGLAYRTPIAFDLEGQGTVSFNYRR
jgi:hypothetical protein